MIYEDGEFNEDSMPTPCQHCNKIFDLMDVVGSEKWYPNTVICKGCADEESDEIQTDEDIEESTNTLEDAVYTINEMADRLETLRVNFILTIENNRVKLTKIK